MPDSGWHMTSIGDWDRYRSKIIAFSHMEIAEEEHFRCKEAFERRLDETTSAVDPSELPKFIQENLQRFTLAS